MDRKQRGIVLRDYICCAARSTSDGIHAVTILNRNQSLLNALPRNKSEDLFIGALLDSEWI